MKENQSLIIYIDYRPSWLFIMVVINYKYKKSENHSLGSWEHMGDIITDFHNDSQLPMPSLDSRPSNSIHLGVSDVNMFELVILAISGFIFEIM